MFHIIERYINIMNKEDVKKFATKNNINLSEEELEFTFQFVKKNWKTILGNPNSFQFERYKNNYSEENYQKMNRLINEYRVKYQSFL